MPYSITRSQWVKPCSICLVHIPIASLYSNICKWLCMSYLYDVYALWIFVQCLWDMVHVIFRPGRCGCNLKWVIFKFISRIDSLSIFCKTDISWIHVSQDLTDDKSALAQAMAWCHQATSHYWSHCLPRSLSLYAVTRPQWVNIHSVFKLFWSGAQNVIQLYDNTTDKVLNFFNSVFFLHWMTPGL